MPYDVKQNYLHYNRPGTALSAEGAVCHSTATQGATAANEFTYYNGGNRGASAHTFIDWSEIIETIPWNERANHAMPSANKRYIGVELCEPYDSDPDRFIKFEEVWKRGVWYFADMFVKKGWDIDRLHSHKWVSETYHESDHTDPYEYLKKYGKTFGDFNDAVASAMVAIKGGGEEFMPDVVVVYFTPADYSVALIVANENGGCATFCRGGSAAVHLDAKRAKKIINIGGPALGLPGEVWLSGDKARDTLKKVAAIL